MIDYLFKFILGLNNFQDVVTFVLLWQLPSIHEDSNPEEPFHENRLNKAVIKLGSL